jgi:hypothetical protein
MLRFSVSSDSDALWRLPRHPDWKYEMVKGEAWLSSRPRPLRLRRSTSLSVPAVTLNGVEVRILDARRDRSEIAELLMDVWVEEDPYRSLEDPETLLAAQIERSLEEPGLGVVAVDEQGVCAVVLVGTDDAGADAGGPMLMWLTVRRCSRARARHRSAARCRGNTFRPRRGRARKRYLGGERAQPALALDPRLSAGARPG